MPFATTSRPCLTSFKVKVRTWQTAARTQTHGYRSLVRSRAGGHEGGNIPSRHTLVCTYYVHTHKTYQHSWLFVVDIPFTLHRLRVLSLDRFSTDLIIFSMPSDTSSFRQGIIRLLHFSLCTRGANCLPSSTASPRVSKAMQPMIHSNPQLNEHDKVRSAGVSRLLPTSRFLMRPGSPRNVSF